MSQQFQCRNQALNVQIPKVVMSLCCIASNSFSVAHRLWVKKGGGWWVKHEDYKASWSTFFWDIEKSEKVTWCIKANHSWLPQVFKETLIGTAYEFTVLQSCLLVTPCSYTLHPLVVRRGFACASAGAGWGLSSARRTGNSGKKRRLMPCCLCQTARSHQAYCSCWRHCRTVCQ